MAFKDPTHVQLCTRLTRSLIVDMQSHWSLAGLDVKEFPSDSYPQAQDYVRTQLARGVLEGTDQAAFDSIDRLDLDHLKNSGVQVNPVQVQGTYQEAQVIAHAEAARHQIEAERFGDASNMSYQEDTIRREAILAQQRHIDGIGTPVHNVATPEPEADADAAAAAQAQADEEAAAAAAAAKGGKK